MAEEELIANLEGKNAEMERFTYTVSHDLKSPLITIRGFLGLLRKDKEKGDWKRMKHDMERIDTAAKHMEELLNDLLELSRIGRIVNPSEEISIGDVASETVRLLSGLFSKRGITVETAPDLPSAFADRLRLGEVYQNLLENAVKYMGDQKEPRIEIGMRREGDETVYYVRDNGIGIDPRYHEKIFGLFERFNHGDDGTGIGLAIVKRIIELHGGRIWIESEGEGKGSTFCFTLPKRGGGHD
jgi:signal transduction histidine kinase